MKLLAKGDVHQVPIGLALGLLLASLGWVWQQQRAEHVQRRSADVGLAQPAETRADQRRAADNAAVWPRAEGQSHGDGWVYDVFTPPAISYDPLTKSFDVDSDPRPVPGVGRGDFGLELVGVEREPFRLQLVGCFGGPGEYLAAFVSPGRAGTLLVRERYCFADAGMTLQRLELKTIAVEHRDAWPVYEAAAFAVLTDDETGTEVVLDSRARKFTDRLLAVFKPLAAKSGVVELRENESVTFGPTTYRIEHIQADPPEVVVAKVTPGALAPEIRTLQVAAAIHPPPMDGATNLFRLPGQRAVGRVAIEK